MGICPVCNGFLELKLECPSCGAAATDRGRIMDFYDDYSAYMPIDQMKLENGYLDFANKQCPHFVKCDQCGYETAYFIQE
ncbi:hypothetical protein [Bacillus tuaregi]|uniref:hypothetical protein n=1 Tax=Bacillus tuaregi TaxID=1816695 RepID=UPI0008F9054A|nr:hypothetical protein [Bacillus tuaregi]